MWRQARSLFADSALTRSLPIRTTLLLRPTLSTTPVPSLCRRFDRLLTTATMEKDEHDLSSKAKTSKKRVGMHVSTKGGLSCVFERTTELGGSAAAFFLKNQRTWKPPKLPDAEVIEEFARQMTKHGIDANCLLPHGNYLVNLCNGAEGEGELLAKSKECFLDEMKRCELLGIKMLNIHPGSTKGKISIEESCKVIADAINEAHSQVADVSVILEITAGGGNAVGKTFEELKMIIDGVTNTDRVGVCLDTCHMFAAGYDIRTQEAYDATMAQFEEVVGLKYLKAIHLNDSKAGLGSKVDRHENIGKGYVGLEAFRCLMNDDRMNGIPLVLETPEGAYSEEVKLLYSLEGNTKPYPPAPDAPGKEKKKTTKKATATKRKKKESESDEDEEDEKKPKGRSAKKSTPRRAKTTNPKSEYDDDDDFQPLAPKKRRLAKRTKKPAARAKEEEEDSDQ